MENLQNQNTQNLEPDKFIQPQMSKQKKLVPAWLGFVIIIIFAIIIFGGVFGYLKFFTPKIQNIIIETSANKTAGWKTYTNTKYGFEWIPPSSWTKYYVEERRSDEFVFGLPLQTSLINGNKKFDMFTLEIVLVSNVDKVKKMGNFFIESIRNDKFVIFTDAGWPTAGYDPCWSDVVNIKNQEKYFCGVYKDINSAFGYSYDFEKSFKFINSKIESSPIKCISGADCQQGYYCALPNVAPNVQPEGYCTLNGTPSPL